MTMAHNTIVQTRRRVDQPEDQLARLRRRLPVCVDLEFFGVPTRIRVGSEQESRQWKHFYKNFPAAQAEAAVEVYLEVEGRPSESFIRSIFRKDFVPKAIWVHERGQLLLWSRFDRWSSVATPLPPFMFPPLRDTLTLFSASAVIAPECRRGVVFLAPPYQGKSTLMNMIVRRGGSPLADNITVTRNGGRELLPYLTPTGIREETLQQLPHLAHALTSLSDDWITVSEVTGRVYLAHVDELHEFEPPVTCEPALLVFPRDDRDGDGGDHRLTSIVPSDLRQRLEEQRIGLTRAPMSELDALAQRTPAVELRYSLLRSNLERVVDDILERVSEAILSVSRNAVSGASAANASTTSSPSMSVSYTP